MTKGEAARLFQRIDYLNELIEDIREEFQWDPDVDPATAEGIADHLGRASEALGDAEWAIHSAYQFPLPED